MAQKKEKFLRTIIVLRVEQSLFLNVKEVLFVLLRQGSKDEEQLHATINVLSLILKFNDFFFFFFFFFYVCICVCVYGCGGGGGRRGMNG